MPLHRRREFPIIRSFTTLPFDGELKYFTTGIFDPLVLVGKQAAQVATYFSEERSLKTGQLEEQDFQSWFGFLKKKLVGNGSGTHTKLLPRAYSYLANCSSAVPLVVKHGYGIVVGSYYKFLTQAPKCFDEESLLGRILT